MKAATAITTEPRRLAALCALWQSAERDVWVTLQGGSMQPTLPPGSRLCLRCSTQMPAVGSIVAFRRNGSLVVHRLREVVHSPAGLQAICQGDANPTPDPPVGPGEVVGWVVEVRSPSAWTRLQLLLRTHTPGPFRAMARRIRLGLRKRGWVDATG